MKPRWLPWFVLTTVMLMAAVPVCADQWYEHYARAERALLEADHATAIAELNLALERRGDSGARVRTYGMRVTDYFPYLKLGIAYFSAGEYEAALRAFDTEEQLGAIQSSEPAREELERFRRRATEAAERRQAEQQQAIDALVDENLAQARDHQNVGRWGEALAAVDRALALSPESTEAGELATVLREELARENDDRMQRERAAQLISDGEALLADGRLVDAAARFRQAAELAPESDAGDLLVRVQNDLAERTLAAAADDPAAVLTRADDHFSRGELDLALGLVQQVMASEPGNTRAAELERRLLDRIAEDNRTIETERLLDDARNRLAAGDFEAAIAAANLVLARDRGHSGALETIQRAYASLSRRLLGEGPAQNLPPAIRFADMREARADGSLVHEVRDPDYRLNGVVIDDSEVAVSVAAGDGSSVATELSTQVVGGVAITEFRLEMDLAAGLTVFEVAATDPEGLTTRSEYSVDYRRPPLRSPRVWGVVIALGAVVAVVILTRKALRRRRMLRRRFNPYVAGPPVLDPALFVGREALLDRVLATVPNNSLLLLGERRIGKTSILQQLRARLPSLQHPRFCFVPVSVDLQGVAEETFFAHVAEAVGEVVGDDRMSDARADEGYDSRELMRDLRRVLPAIECPDDRRAKLVLLLDEIDELNGYSHRTNQRLRSLFMRSFADQLVAVAAGVGIAREWDHEGSPWYNFFEEIEVGTIDTEASRELATRPLRGVISIDDDAVDRMLAVAEGRPYVLQKLALAAVQRVHEERRARITVEDVDAVAGS